MHHALFLPEITCNIFELLNPFLSGPEGSHEPNPLRLRDLAAVATTCHALGDPALDVLWDTQVCFGPLLMCLPPSVIEVRDSDYEPDEDRSIISYDEPFLRRSIHLVQDPLPSDLLRMLPYARRIKRICSPGADCRWPLPELFSIPSHTIDWLLSAHPMENFLPRLTHMSCPDFVFLMGMGNIRDVSFTPLSRSNLTSLEVNPEFDNEVEGWPLLSIMANDLPQLRTIKLGVSGWHCSMRMLYSEAIAPLCLFYNLEHLDLHIYGKVPEGPGLAGLQMFPRLQKLKLSSDTKFAVSFLTALQSTLLHTLDLTMESPTGGDQPVHLDRLFSSLRCLTISSDFCFMMSLIEAVHSSALDSISLNTPITFDEQIVRALTALISSKRGWGSSLRTITIDRPGFILPVDDVFCGPDHPYFFSIEDLLVFSHLQHVTLDNLVISLDASVCKKLATGWPDLVEFNFNPFSIEELATTTIDPGTLVTFARHCPNLLRLELGIPWDTTELPVLDDETLTILSSRPTRSACMRIVVDADSSLANPKAVAKFLATVFPGREIKIVLAASFCRKSLHLLPPNEWCNVVEWLRKSQLSSLEFGPCYRTQLCAVCRFGLQI
ncbi:uncharacterized protein EDB91DRAFT_1344853 [Suillus paluster]|uniref:uncharacterized protein n=1 Tax=Suillus paluster TaxID=48578 RepID=UPI001B86C904|nr:uncharacterized protein EDB91DRAFT_1344853 [Suillus paluster]KAG1748295.1 hypothetical protein EDB91DRAFT_1344853 [Suillus paluster]